MLATVRRLAIPVLIGQINIAGKQTNVNCGANLGSVSMEVR